MSDLADPLELLGARLKRLSALDRWLYGAALTLVLVGLVLPPLGTWALPAYVLGARVEVAANDGVPATDQWDRPVQFYPPPSPGDRLDRLGRLPRPEGFYSFGPDGQDDRGRGDDVIARRPEELRQLGQLLWSLPLMVLPLWELGRAGRLWLFGRAPTHFLRELVPAGLVGLTLGLVGGVVGFWLLKRLPQLKQELRAALVIDPLAAIALTSWGLGTLIALWVRYLPREEEDDTPALDREAEERKQGSNPG